MKNIFLVILPLLAMSCRSPRTLYISNKQDRTITLLVDTLRVDTIPAPIAFADSLHRKRLNPGHMRIHFGNGKWTKQDRENLKLVLQKTSFVNENLTGTISMSPTIRVIHYGAFVNELVIKIYASKLKEIKQ